MNRSTIQSICNNYYVASDKLTRHFKLSERAFVRVALHPSFEDENDNELIVPRIVARASLRKIERDVDDERPNVGGGETKLYSTYMEYEEMRSDEVLAYVDVLKICEAWNKNELEDLPPSTTFDPGERQRRRYRGLR